MYGHDLNLLEILCSTLYQFIVLYNPAYKLFLYENLRPKIQMNFTQKSILFHQIYRHKNQAETEKTQGQRHVKI